MSKFLLLLSAAVAAAWVTTAPPRRSRTALSVSTRPISHVEELLRRPLGAEVTAEAMITWVQAWAELVPESLPYSPMPLAADVALVPAGAHLKYDAVPTDRIEIEIETAACLFFRTP